jgi:hypothetical protein
MILYCIITSLAKLEDFLLKSKLSMFILNLQTTLKNIKEQVKIQQILEI